MTTAQGAALAMPPSDRKLSVSVSVIGRGSTDSSAASGSPSHQRRVSPGVPDHVSEGSEESCEASGDASNRGDDRQWQTRRGRHNGRGSAQSEAGTAQTTIVEGQNSCYSAGSTLGGFARLQTRSVVFWNPSMTYEETCDSIGSIVRNSAFDYAICVVLFINAITIGVQVNYEAANFMSDEVPLHFRIMELIFFIVFAGELGLRFFSEGFLGFFRATKWRWNVFDLIMVFAQFVEVVNSLADTRTGLPVSVKTMNLLRVLRTTRIIRVLRMVHLVRELDQIWYLIVGSFWPFVWTLFLLVVMTYMMGIICTQLVAERLRQADDVPELTRYYGTLGSSFLYLFGATSGGVNWADLVEPLSSNISPLLAMLLCGYIIFGVLVVMNLVTGVFVESASRQMKNADSAELLKKVLKGFQSADMNGDRIITVEEFCSVLETPHMKDVLDTIGVTREEAYTLFTILDFHSTGRLTAEELVQGAMRLRSPGRIFDLESLRQEMWAEYHEMAKVRQDLHALSLMLQKPRSNGCGSPKDGWNKKRSNRMFKHARRSRGSATADCSSPSSTDTLER
mmetsp:Transcript_85331/g.217455  ORF Transcript_85331/g.217455 Transcript_85331/m.217455 type:complete len:565 (+) Transcript_85331:655-2349(+)